jgi:uncharacterized protein YlxW (UPF0749 family)
MRKPAIGRPSAGLARLVRRPGTPRSPWSVLVPAVLLLAGFGFATSAHVSGGTTLRAPGTANLADLVRSAEGQVQRADARVSALQQQVASAAAQAGRGDSRVQAAQRSAEPLLAPGGLTAVHGPGIEVILNDADPDDDSGTHDDSGVDPNQLVVHQSDLQAVVNALWTGGAEAMTIAGQRVIATSAVRCVGNTLLLNGDVYSPPFRVQAIGPYQAMQSALNASPGVRLFQQAASYYGLGYTAESQTDLRLPAYSGSISLEYAKAGTH